jgi:5-methylcytosine-specific restriction protein A
LDWNALESSIVNLTNIHNRVNADALFVSLIIEMDKRGMDLQSTFKISLIAQLIPKGTANVTNYATYGFSIMSMLSGQKQRDYFLFEKSHLRDEFTSVANNNTNRDNYHWLKNHPDELVRINPKYFRKVGCMNV